MLAQSKLAGVQLCFLFKLGNCKHAICTDVWPACYMEEYGVPGLVSQSLSNVLVFP